MKPRCICERATCRLCNRRRIARESAARIRTTPEGKARTLTAHDRYRKRNWAKVTFRLIRHEAAKRGYASLAMSMSEFVLWHGARVIAANGHCEWCGVEVPLTRLGLPKLVCDHDHITGLPRALVCWRCNLIEGNADTPEQLEAVAGVMRAHSDGVDWRHEETLESLC